MLPLTWRRGKGHSANFGHPPGRSPAVLTRGELAADDDVLLDAIREMIDQRTSPAPGHPYKVVRSALADKAEVLGAVALAMINASAERLERAPA